MAQIKQNKINGLKVKTAAILTVLALVGQISAVQAKGSDITAVAVIKLVNESRKEAGLSPLLENAKLRAAAENKAKDMSSYNYFAHYSPSGKSPWDFIMEQKYDYRYAGENLAIDYTDAKEQHEAWMESPLHRQNILSADYKEIGVAVMPSTIDGRKTIITVQEFGAQLAKESAVIPSNDTFPKKTVAGLSVQSNIKDDSKAQASLGELKKEATKQMELGQIFEENKFTLAGWLLVAGLAVLMTLSDAAFILYRKHRHS